MVTWCHSNEREDILEEWDYDLNEGKQPQDYTQGSGVEIVWKCQICKTPMRYKIIERTQRGFGCTKCKVSGTSFPEQFIYSLFRFLFNDAENRYKLEGTELDIYIPSIKIAVEYNGTYYHRNSEEKDLLKEVLSCYKYMRTEKIML